MNKLFFTIAFSFIIQNVNAQTCQDISVVQIPPDCPQIFAPVCGCDGNTYTNICFAQQAGGVTSWTIGACPPTCVDQDLIDPDVLCPGIFLPVCGCNGVTYSNACEATNYGGVIEYVDGACPTGCINEEQIDSSFACQEVYDPVCGCDSVTYQNNCYATYYGGVPVYSQGPCPLTYCKDFSTIDSTFECLLIDAPVCGCDSITYANACEAEKYNGVRSWTEGPCNVSINDYQKFTVSIFPNPAEKVLNLKLGDIKEAKLFRIFNTYGQEVLGGVIKQSLTTVDVSSFASGVYYISIQNSNLNYSKFVVIH